MNLGWYRIVEWDGSLELVSARIVGKEEYPFEGEWVEVTYMDGKTVHIVDEAYFFGVMCPTTVQMPEPSLHPQYN